MTVLVLPRPTFVRREHNPSFFFAFDAQTVLAACKKAGIDVKDEFGEPINPEKVTNG